jgi:hypothetical protein
VILELDGPRDGFDAYGRRWFKHDDVWYPRDLSEAEARILTLDAESELDQHERPKLVAISPTTRDQLHETSYTFPPRGDAR